MHSSRPQFPVSATHRSPPMSNSQYDSISSHANWHTDVSSSTSHHLSDYLPSSSHYPWDAPEQPAWSSLTSAYHNFDSHSDHNNASSETSFTSDTSQTSPNRSQHPHHLSHSQSSSQPQHQQKSFSSALFPAVGSFPYTSLASSSASPSSALDGRPKFAPASWEGHEMCRIDPDLDQDPYSPSASSDPQPRPATATSAAVDPSRPSTPRTPSSIVKKEEEPEDGFVFELSSNPAHQSFAPMTEVPLRATHASKSQRKLMTSFRLDPFATQNGIRVNTENKNWLGEDIGPHTEEPVLIEFQIELTVPLISPSLTNSPLPPFDDTSDLFSSGSRILTGSTMRPMLPLPSNSPLTQYLRNVGPVNHPPAPSSAHPVFPPTPPQIHPTAPTSIHTTSPNLLYPYEDRNLEDDDTWMPDEGTSFSYSSSAHASRAVDMAIDGPAPGESSASSGAPFESVMTPAQSLQWQMGFQAGDPSCMAYPNGVTTSKPTRVNLTSRYHTSHSHSSLKRHALTSPTNAYSPPTVDVNVLFPAARSSTLQHASGSGLTLGGPHQTRSAQRCDVQSTVSSTGVHWNKNHTSSASSVSSLTDDDEPFYFPTEENPWPSHQHVSSGSSAMSSSRHNVTSDLSTRRAIGGIRQRQTHNGGHTPCFA